MMRTITTVYFANKRHTENQFNHKKATIETSVEILSDIQQSFEKSDDAAEDQRLRSAHFNRWKHDDNQTDR